MHDTAYHQNNEPMKQQHTTMNRLCTDVRDSMIHGKRVSNEKIMNCAMFDTNSLTKKSIAFS